MVREWAALCMVLQVENPAAHLPPDTRVEQGRDPKAAGSDPKIDLVKAVEALSEPINPFQENLLALKKTVGVAPYTPPNRRFRQGEI